MTRRYALLAMLLTLAMTMAACAGDSDDETADTSGTDDTTDTADGTTGATADDGGGDETEPGGDVEGTDIACGGESFSFGVAMPLTGSQAALGEEFVRWAERGVEQVNEEYDFDVEMVVEDTQATAEVGLTALNRLAEVENVPIVFTAWSSVVQAMAPVATDLDVALVNNGANDPTLAGVGDLVNMYPLASVDLQAMVEWSREVQEYATAAIIYIDNATGEGAADLYEEVFTELGGEIVAVESVRPESVDASAQVARALDADPDVVHVHALAGEVPVIIRELEAQGYEGDMSTYSVAEFADVRESAGSSMAGMYYATTSPEQTPELEEDEQWYRDTFGSAPAISYASYQMGSPHFFARVVEHLCQSGRDVTGANINGAIEEVGTFELPNIGEISVREDGTVTLPVRIKQVPDDPTAAGAPDDEVVHEVVPE